MSPGGTPIEYRGTFALSPAGTVLPTVERAEAPFHRSILYEFRTKVNRLVRTDGDAGSYMGCRLAAGPR